jgi:signal peptidase
MFNPKRARLISRLATVALCVAIIALAAMLAGRVAGYRMLVIRSGSMTPTLPVGDVIVSRPVRPSGVGAGDIVTFRDPALRNALVTHRVVSKTTRGETVAFVTKGDANTAVEHWNISSTGTLGKEVVTLPALGRMLAAVESPIALTIAVALLILCGLYKVLRSIWRNDRDREPPSGSGRTRRWVRAGTSALCAVMLCASVNASTASAWAATNVNRTNQFVASTSFPTINSVTLQNHSGGTAGVIEKGDQVIVAFSTTMKVSSFCSTWSGDNNDQTLAGNGDVIVTVHDGTGAAHDFVTVASGTCSFNFGSVDLGTNAYVSGGDVTFTGTGTGKSTIVWTAATHTLTITLGRASGGTASAVASSTATYTASPSITDTVGGILTNSPFTLTNGQDF